MQLPRFVSFCIKRSTSINVVLTRTGYPTRYTCTVSPTKSPANRGNATREADISPQSKTNNIHTYYIYRIATMFHGLNMLLSLFLFYTHTHTSNTHTLALSSSTTVLSLSLLRSFQDCYLIWRSLQEEA